MANARSLKTKVSPCGKGQIEDPNRSGVCIEIDPVLSLKATVFQGPDCWPPSVQVPTSRLGPFVQRKFIEAAREEFEGLSRTALARKLKELKGRRARMKKIVASSRKGRAK